MAGLDPAARQMPGFLTGLFRFGSDGQILVERAKGFSGLLSRGQKLLEGDRAFRHFC